MKKTVIRVFLPIFVLVLILTSCLGDSDSKVHDDRRLSYIKESSEVYALTWRREAITSEAIQQLGSKKGRFCYIKFEYYTSSMSNGFFIADYADLAEDLFLEYAGNNGRLNYSDPDNDPVKDEFIAIDGFGEEFFSAHNDFDDKWVMKCASFLKKGERIEPYFYFNRFAQTDEPKDGEPGVVVGEEKMENKVVVDVKFRKVGTPEDPESEAKLTTSLAVVNFQDLRASYLINTTGDGVIELLGKYIALPIKFRFLSTGQGENGNMIGVAYAGKWGAQSTDFFLAIEKP